jgi:hypothetical protein
MTKIALYFKTSIAFMFMAGIALFPFSQVSAQESTSELVEYASGVNDVILELYQTYEVVDPNPKPRFTLYGDGRVEVYFPPFMKRSGTYELTLSVGEMEELLLFLSSRGVFSFDSTIAKQAKKSARQARTEQARQGTFQLIYRSDETVTTIRSNLSSYTPAGTGAKAVQNYTKEIKWQGLQNDAKDHPGITSLTNLAEAEITLLDYCNVANLKKTK